MANPASILVTNCTANGRSNQPNVQAFDANGDIPYTVGGYMELLILEVINTAAAALTVTIKGSDRVINNPNVVQAQNLSIILAAAGGGDSAKSIIGPFESYRFLQKDGRVIVNFLAASGAPSGTIRAYRLPKM